MQLTGPGIKKRMKQTLVQRITNQKPDIVITPFYDDCLGSNSYDLHLSNKLVIYANTLPVGMRPVIEITSKTDFKKLSMRDWFLSNEDYERYLAHPEEFDRRNPKFTLDPRDPEKETMTLIIPESGVIISPMVGYLGSSLEWTETRNLFPYIDGKSSTGRNFIQNHYTAGRGDDGFCGTWTLEIGVQYPTILYPNMRIGQIYYETFVGKRKPYDRNPNSHYNGQRDPTAAAAVPIENFQKIR